MNAKVLIAAKLHICYTFPYEQNVKSLKHANLVISLRSTDKLEKQCCAGSSQLD